jgi:hypothetical protein
MAFLLIVKSSSIQKSLRKPVRVVAETSQQSKSEI